MIVSIASGKGGTGKTTLATNLAWVASQRASEVTYLDCDVEEPNGHLFLHPQWQATEPIEKQVPEVDQSRCTLCERCSDFCRFGAIICAAGQVTVFEELCHGCGGCRLVCPEEAIHERARRMGTLRLGRSGRMRVVDGVLDVGQHLGPPAIREVKRRGLSRTEETGAPSRQEVLTVIDAPPGTSCSMVEAVRQSDLVVLVTEPTPFGVHDLQLALETVEELGLAAAVVVNRAGLNDASVDACCRRANVPVIGRLPESWDVAAAYSEGLLAAQHVSGYRDRIERIWQAIGALTRVPCVN